MLKIKTKFRCIIALHMCIPIAVIIGYARGKPLFYNPEFQGALGVSVAVCILLSFCSPMLPGLKWIFFSQLDLVARICSHIKTGKYTYFSLPNEPTDDSGENEMVALMRDMNWMIRQIESREAELENRVARRTRALRKSNTALVAARDAARASARAKSEFLATMSHEIRTPMNAIIGMSNLAVKANQDPGIKEHLSIIHSSSVSLLRIINDILDFSKMDAGKLVLETIPVRIRDLLEELSDMFRGQLSGGSVELILDISPKVPGTIPGDPLRLRQVLTNLISNAIKFTREGEVIVRVTFDVKDKGWSDLQFSVQDSGIGMDDAAVKSLFTPFTQADGSITREFGGTGLGLAISQNLVSLMGSRISVDSQKGIGSCFAFTLAVETALIRGNPDLEPPNHASKPKVSVMASNAAGRPETSRTHSPQANLSREIPPDVPAMVTELGRLIEQNSLTAKAFSRDLAAKLSATTFGDRAMQLETQIKRFEFQKARDTFKTLENEINTCPTG
ncbi:MAG: ATP-binding protein [Desulfobacterales bacterium]|nr:ATP-binding protein [Desulfobacterales bacterium]